MKTVKIDFQYPEKKQSPLHLEIKDSLNELLLEVKHDFLDKNIQLDYHVHIHDEYHLKINDQEVDFECHCQEDFQACLCQPIDKIRKALFQAANVKLSGCACGGNCGCH